MVQLIFLEKLCLYARRDVFLLFLNFWFQTEKIILRSCFKQNILKSNKFLKTITIELFQFVWYSNTET